MDKDAIIASIVASAEFPIDTERTRNLLWVASERRPLGLARGLLKRLERDLKLPYRCEAYMAPVALIEDGPILERLEKDASDVQDLSTVAAIAGPKIVAALVAKYLDLSKQIRSARLDQVQAGQSLLDAERRMQNAISTCPLPSLTSTLVAHGGTRDVGEIIDLAELLAQHGNSSSDMEGPFSHADAAPMVPVMLAWVRLILSDSGITRWQLANLARACGKLGDERLRPALQQLLVRDLEMWAEQRNTRSPRDPHSEAAMSYVNQYQNAFSRIGGSETVALMRTYLTHPTFGEQAAIAIRRIEMHDLPITDKAGGLQRWNDYSGVRAARKQRTEGPLPSTDAAEAIFSAASQLTENGAADQEMTLAISIGVQGLVLPHGAKDADLAALLALPIKHRTKTTLLKFAARVGYELPSRLITEGFAELMEDSKTESWRLEPNSGQLIIWLELIAFSEQPAELLHMLEKLDVRHRHAHELDSVFRAFRCSPHPEALPVFLELGRRYPEYGKSRFWWSALADFDTTEAAMEILNLIAQGHSFGANAQGAKRWSEYIADWANADANLRQQLISLFATDVNRSAFAVLSQALAHMGEPRLTLLLIERYAEIGAKYDYTISSAVEKSVTIHEPVVSSSNTYSVRSRAAKGFRSDLFNLVVQGGKTGEIAKQCLVQIDELRDEYGQPLDEPRHPCFELGIPWPML
jgi:hypothetical protein